MSLLWSYLRRHRGVVALGFLFVLATNVVALLGPWVLRHVVDGLRAGIGHRTLLLYAGLILGVALVQGAFRFLARITLIGLSRTIEYRLRMDTFDHLQKLPPEFFQVNRTGDIISRATSDLENVRLFLGPGVMNFLNTSVLFAGAIAFMASLSPRLTVVALAPLPVAAMLMARASSLYHRRYKAVQESNARLSSQAQENFAGIRVVKAYAQEERQTEAFLERNLNYLAANLKLARVIGFFHPLIGFVVGMASVVILWAGGRMIIAGSLTLGQLVAFLGLMSMLIWPTIALGWVVNLLQRGIASAGRIRMILGTVPAIRDPEDPAPVDSIEGSVEFRRLTFTYPGMPRPALRDVSLAIRPGTKVALVGRTGSGKSTLAALIPRLWNVPDGTLLLDGTDVNRLRLSVLRGAVGFVPQETVLFSDTLWANIGLGRRADQEAVLEATRLAGLEPDLGAFPEGLDTLVGERGITLSGGQKQRAAIARALVRDPAILVLDDVFSSVDAETERTVLRNLRGVMAGRTTLVITHRLSSITDADLIVVLDDGRVAEQGRHEELLAAGGRYADMFRRQALAEELELEGEPG